MMGEVDEKPFIKLCEQRFSDKTIQLEHAVKLVSKWQNALKDPAWHPFKRIGTGQKMKVRSHSISFLSLPVLS